MAGTVRAGGSLWARMVMDGERNIIGAGQVTSANVGTELLQSSFLVESSALEELRLWGKPQSYSDSLEHLIQLRCYVNSWYTTLLRE